MSGAVARLVAKPAPFAAADDSAPAPPALFSTAAAEGRAAAAVPHFMMQHTIRSEKDEQMQSCAVKNGSERKACGCNAQKSGKVAAPREGMVGWRGWERAAECDRSSWPFPASELLCFTNYFMVTT
jgi:hypothetical protein